MINQTSLTLSEIKYIHNELIKTFGGDNSIHDKGLLESCIQMPYLTFGGEELYPDIFDKAARILTGFVMNQVFADGNKRIGIASTLIFLGLHGYVPICNVKDLTDFVLNISRNSNYSLEDISFFLKNIVWKLIHYH